jgi:hypothetical protein
MAFSNVPGPVEEISFYGHPVAYIAPSVYGHPHVSIKFLTIIFVLGGVNRSGIFFILFFISSLVDRIR